MYVRSQSNISGQDQLGVSTAGNGPMEMNPVSCLMSPNGIDSFEDFIPIILDTCLTRTGQAKPSHELESQLPFIFKIIRLRRIVIWIIRIGHFFILLTVTLLSYLTYQKDQRLCVPPSPTVCHCHRIFFCSILPYAPIIWLICKKCVKNLHKILSYINRIRQKKSQMISLAISGQGFLLGNDILNAQNI